ncbi:MAG TPA: biopolymer transporter ExbD [Phycisphaerae bacterium]|nr:biopolymer transporter ExbD [Phycisphaerae bacterium]
MTRRSRRDRRRPRGEPEIPTQSFADIAFLLIIYFILAASLSQDLGFRTDIPAGQKATEATEDRTVLLRQDGLFWGERPVSIGELRGELAGMKLADRDPNHRVVQFEAKGDVLWQSYFEVLDAIGKAGGQPGIVMEGGQK